MKIGMFTDSYRPYTSGVVRSIETTSAKLMELGHEVYIFAPSYPQYEKEARVFRFMSIPSPTYPEFTIALPFSLYLRPTIKKLGLDVIHVHSPFTLGLLGARYARRYGLPLVFTYHTMYDQYVHYLPFAQGISRRVVLSLSRNFCNRCDLVITPTEIIKGIVGKNIRTRIEAIPTGIETEEFLQSDSRWLRNTYGIGDETKILLHLGRLGKEKNIGFVFAAYQKIHQSFSPTKLVIVGDGPEKSRLEEEARRMGLGNHIIFTGPLSRQNVINSYAGADLFVFASTTETQGIVLGEAKAAGLPSVAVNALGASEMVKDGLDGFLTPLSSDIFVDRVLKLLRDESLRSRMAGNALLEAEKISALSMAVRLAGAYEAIFRAKKQHRFSAV
jgi:glycosyltransferase involved in cell wall biosynthesis